MKLKEVSGYILDNAQDFGCQKCEKPELELFFHLRCLSEYTANEKDPRLIAFLYDGGQATTKNYKAGQPLWSVDPFNAKPACYDEESHKHLSCLGTYYG